MNIFYYQMVKYLNMDEKEIMFVTHTHIYIYI
jgi:hypothetical protein